MSLFTVDVLVDGFSHEADNGEMIANCSCTLVTGQGVVMVVDTLSPWDRDMLVNLLASRGVSPDDVTHLVCTHGHPDHVGNNNLFTGPGIVNHVVGHSVHNGNRYFPHDFSKGEILEVAGSGLSIIPTPGHTLDSVSVVVDTSDLGIVVIAGDLFEKEEDLEDAQLWIDAGSEDEEKQRLNRNKVLQMASYIVPGHGPMFRVEKL